MFNLNYLKRLSLHGSRFVWRVLMIFLPVVGYSLIEAVKKSTAGTDAPPYDEEPPFGYLDHYGTPEYSNTTDAQWAAYYKNKT